MKKKHNAYLFSCWAWAETWTAWPAAAASSSHTHTILQRAIQRMRTKFTHREISQADRLLHPHGGRRLLHHLGELPVLGHRTRDDTMQSHTRQQHTWTRRILSFFCNHWPEEGVCCWIVWINPVLYCISVLFMYHREIERALPTASHPVAG